ncbi:hypothetical protein YC2023_059811 [Brassica napus]
MSLSQRLLVAKSHRQIREEAANRTDIGASSDREAQSGGLRSSECDDSGALMPPQRSYPRVRFDQINCRPTVYNPSGIFEELSPLPPESLRDPRAEGQSWKNVFDSCSSHKSVKDLLRRYGGTGITYIIPSNGQRPWSPPVGYQCVYKSYFGDQTKLWFPIPRLVTSYAFRRDIAICQLLNGVTAHCGHADGDGRGDRHFDECESVRGVDFHKGRTERDIPGEDAFELQRLDRASQQDERLAAFVFLRQMRQICLRRASWGRLSCSLE